VELVREQLIDFLLSNSQVGELDKEHLVKENSAGKIEGARTIIPIHTQGKAIATPSVGGDGRPVNVVESYEMSPYR
jgi:hypothetical protein